MQKTTFFLFLFIICACDYPFSKSKKTSVNKTHKIFSPKVYLSKHNQFIDIQTLNRQNHTLNLSDQIVFSNTQDFFNNSNSEYSNLMPLELVNKENINFKISSFCSKSKMDLENLNQTDRLFQELASTSFQSQLFVINLIPKEFLLESLEKIFYCSFIFGIRNKDKIFTYYNLAQQSIQVSTAQTNNLVLVYETNSGYKYSPTDYVIQNRNIKHTLLLNKTNQPVTNYELYCEGIKIMDIPDFKINISPIFTNLMAIENLPNKSQNCRLFSKNTNDITGVSNSFVIDFESLNIKNNSIDLQQLEEPVFVNTAEINVYPDFFKLPYDFYNPEEIKPFAKRPEAYIYPENSLAINSYIHFKNLNEISLNANYNSTEVVLNTSCMDSNPKNNLFELGKTVSTTVRIPLKQKIPIAVALPPSIFEMGTVYDNWLKELIDLYKISDQLAVWVDDRIPENDTRERFFNEKYVPMLEKEHDLKQSRHQITCLYNIKIEDKDKPQNYIEFETKVFNILWTRDSYGVIYTAFPQGENPFITLNEQINIDQRDFESKVFNIQGERDSYNIIYTAFSQGKNPFIILNQQANTDQREFRTIDHKSLMGYLSLTFSDLIDSPLDQDEENDLKEVVLACKGFEEPYKKLKLSWPYKANISNQIVLKDLFSHSDFKLYMEKEVYETACRVLFYGQDNILKYFSGEIRLR
ncbi:MAG: hypothetical protein OXC37_03310 [Bdellovibrionaceae bacterium]|nr:hypothetical protein [Pseudobdellovibrionaceae bacterium]